MVAAPAPPTPLITPETPAAGSRCSCWQSDHGKTLTSAPVSGMTRPIQDQSRRAAHGAKLGAEQRQRLAGVGRVVGEGGAADAIRFVFSPDADHERMSLHHPRRVEHLERGLAGGDDGAVGKGNPLALILAEELVAHRPVGGLVLAPIGMDFLCNFRRQRVRQAFHRSPRVQRRAMTSFYSHRVRPGTVAFEKKNGQKRGPLFCPTRLRESTMPPFPSCPFCVLWLGEFDCHYNSQLRELLSEECLLDKAGWVRVRWIRQ